MHPFGVPRSVRGMERDADKQGARQVGTHKDAVSLQYAALLQVEAYASGHHEVPVGGTSEE